MANEWQIRNVPKKTRAKIKKYATDNNLNIAGALTALAEKINK